MKTKLSLGFILLLLSGCASFTLVGDAPESQPPASPSDLQTTSEINQQQSHARTTESRN